MLRPDLKTIARGGFLAACLFAGTAPQAVYANDDLVAQGKRVANGIASGRLKASELTPKQHHAMRVYALHLRGQKTTTVKDTVPPGMTHEALSQSCRVATPDAKKSALICTDPALERVPLNCSATIGDDGIRVFACGSPALSEVIAACVVAPGTVDRLLCE